MAERLRVSRIHRLKRDANRDAKWWKKNGGTEVKVVGVQGQWKASAFMEMSPFAKFCSLEAKRDSANG